MKQEIYIRILSCIITLAISLSLCVGLVHEKNILQRLNYTLDKIDGLKINSRQSELTKVNKIEQLTRENVVLRQTVADLSKQIEEFGWMKTAMDKEGVNP
jgi:cell division protein FtsB